MKDQRGPEQLFVAQPTGPLAVTLAHVAAAVDRPFGTMSLPIISLPAPCPVWHRPCDRCRVHAVERGPARRSDRGQHGASAMVNDRS